MKNLILLFSSIVAFCSFKIAPKALSVAAICACGSSYSQNNYYLDAPTANEVSLRVSISASPEYKCLEVFDTLSTVILTDTFRVESTTLKLKGNSNQYISGSGAFVNFPTITPIGSVQFYSGSSAPTGYLLCDGMAVSRTTYADLFAICGTIYGSGDGSTTFNLPDLRQRFPLTKSDSGTGNTLGATGGTIDHVHTVDPPNTTSGTPSGNVAATNLTGSAASTTHTHDVNISQFNSGTSNPPFLVLNAIIKY